MFEWKRETELWVVRAAVRARQRPEPKQGCGSAYVKASALRPLPSSRPSQKRFHCTSSPLSKRIICRAGWTQHHALQGSGERRRADLRWTSWCLELWVWRLLSQAGLLTHTHTCRLWETFWTRRSQGTGSSPVCLWPPSIHPCRRRCSLLWNHLSSSQTTAAGNPQCLGLMKKNSAYLLHYLSGKQPLHFKAETGLPVLSVEAEFKLYNILLPKNATTTLSKKTPKLIFFCCCK